MNEELSGGFKKDIVGYCDPLSALPGDSISFKLGAWNGSGEASAQIVKLISGDDRPHGTGLIESPVEELESVAVEHQLLAPGSYGVVEDLPSITEGSISLWFYPTLLRAERQTILSTQGISIKISESGVYILGDDGDVYLEVELQIRRWYALSLEFGASSKLTLTSKPEGLGDRNFTLSVEGSGLSASGGSLYLACLNPGDETFNGRLQDVVVSSVDRVVMSLDFSQAINSQTIIDASENSLNGTLHQNPTRCVAGVEWDGTVQSYHIDPDHYRAIHFHEDDFTDAGWHESLAWSVPKDLASGQYALKVTLRDSEDYIPFFVRAPKGKRSKLAYLVPTASYLAYANQRMNFGGFFSKPTLRHANDAFTYAHEDLGYSLYEYHRDQSGVHFSSRLRPILNMKPRTGTWAFNADTHITAWLDAIDQDFDVVTDEDLHVEGIEALEGYQLIITGTHPEYYSTRMRDSLEQWLSNNGRLMYMGGNGFYWRVAFQEDNPAIMEVRRAEDGTRAWIAEPGEYYHQFNGEYGGMWRRLGKPPNQLVGIGFAAQGFDGGTYYKVQSGALDPRVDFIVNGISDVSQDDTWGSFGNQGGGAAGEEIDRFDLSLGSPAHAVILATSENHRPGMLRVKEEFHMMEPPTNDPKVRADMVFFEVEGGGAVFSTGSISYAGSLAHNDYDNEIAKLTTNVVQRFLDPEPFEYPG